MGVGDGVGNMPDVVGEFVGVTLGEISGVADGEGESGFVEGVEIAKKGVGAGEGE